MVHPSLRHISTCLCDKEQTYLIIWLGRVAESQISRKTDDIIRVIVDGRRMNLRSLG
jgi:hypothetical protein